MKTFPTESIDMVMFSPPYYGLRNYGEATETVWNGNEKCEHEWVSQPSSYHKPNWDQETPVEGGLAKLKELAKQKESSASHFCVKCEAWKGQLGLEPSWRMYVEHLVTVCRELKRVLKKTGSMYIVLGDTYFGGGHGGNTLYKTPSGKLVKSVKQGESSNYVPIMNWKDEIYKPKCLLGIPWRVAFALIDDGWILRNDIAWHKPNSMPSSVRDRLTNTWEHVFHFVKNRKYYYNLDAIREPPKWPIVWSRKGSSKEPWKINNPRARWGLTRNEFEKLVKHDLAVNRVGKLSYTDPLHTRAYNIRGKNPGDVFRIPCRSKFSEVSVKTGSPAARALKTIKSGRLTSYVKKKILDVGAYLKAKRKEAGTDFDELSRLTGIKKTTLEHYFRTDFSGQALPDRKTWELLKPILNLGNYDDFISEEIRLALPQPHPLGRNPGDFWSICTKPFKGAHFAVYPEEICVKPILSSSPPDGIVLDPMCGSGTTCLVALKFGRRFIGIDVNPEYINIAKKRLHPYMHQKLTTFLLAEEKP
jgi:DNA modification methylase